VYHAEVKLVTCVVMLSYSTSSSAIRINRCLTETVVKDVKLLLDAEIFIAEKDVDLAV
jgi:hypothetical protein